jgi:hypothetical protein
MYHKLVFGTGTERFLQSTESRYTTSATAVKLACWVHLQDRTPSVARYARTSGPVCAAVRRQRPVSLPEVWNTYDLYRFQPDICSDRSFTSAEEVGICFGAQDVIELTSWQQAPPGTFRAIEPWYGESELVT